MAADPEFDPMMDAALLAEAKQAAARWDRRSPIRDARSKALREGRALEADSRQRLTMRVNTLVENTRRAAHHRRPPVNLTLRTLVEAAGPLTEAELNEDILREVVQGARDFLDVEFLERGARVARSVGRIVIRTGRGVRARGTGFLVAPGLIITNHHVLPNAETAELCGIEMDYELNSSGPPKVVSFFALEPARLYLADKALDFALVATASRSPRGTRLDDYVPIPLIAVQGKIVINGDDFLNIIQHPLGREKEIVVRDNRVLDLRTGDETADAEMEPFLHYQGDTEKGSSGSPVFNDAWEVVALHHSGVPRRDAQGNWLDKSGKIWRENEQPAERIDWVANEGIRVSKLVDAFRTASDRLRADQRALIQDVLDGTRPSDAVQQPESADTPGATPGAAARLQPAPGAGRPTDRSTPPVAAAVATLEIPLRISFSIGGAAAVVAAPPGDGGTAAASPAAPLPTRLTPAMLREPAPPAVDAAQALLEERLDASDFADRDGFDENFLGVRVPMPRLKQRPRFGGALAVPRPARPADTTLLRYVNYSVVMCAGRRLAYVSACNIDFAARSKASSEETNGNWRLDPRIDPDHQLDNEYYRNNEKFENQYDRGHLSRRDDCAWGRTKRQAIAASKDTYFYTNAAPQFFAFNQSNRFSGLDLGLWGDLEDWISEQGGDQRARLCVFNGPIFGMNDKPLFDVTVPLKYFKIVVWRDGNAAPGAVAFVLDQASLIETLPEEAIDPGRFKINQVGISKLQTMTDLNLEPLAAFEKKRRPGAQESLDEEADLPIRKLSDVMV